MGIPRSDRQGWWHADAEQSIHAWPVFKPAARVFKMSKQDVARLRAPNDAFHLQYNGRAENKQSYVIHGSRRDMHLRN